MRGRGAAEGARQAGAIYFAYGSNLDVEQMARRCPGHRVLGRALLADYRLCFPRRSLVRGCGTAGIEPCPGGQVWGALYVLTSEDVRALHAHEGFDPHGPAHANRHVPTHVEVATGEGRLRAYTYLAVPDGSGALPSPDYLGHLLRGAVHHGLPQDYVAWLRALATAPGSVLVAVL